MLLKKIVLIKHRIIFYEIHKNCTLLGVDNGTYEITTDNEVFILDLFSPKFLLF